jgi:hypothetical protein
MFRQFLHHHLLRCLFDPAAGDYDHTAGADPLAQQAETFPYQTARTVSFYGEQTEFSAAYYPAFGKFFFALHHRHRHKHTGTAEGGTSQAFKLNLAKQF